MASNTPKEITVFFDQVLEEFDAMTTMADGANVVEMDRQTAQNSSETVWRPEAQIGDIQNGLDVSGLQTDILELSVPSSLDTIDNDTFTLTSLELRDKRFMKRRAKAAAIKLSANLNQNMANLVAQTGTLVVNQAALPSSYTDIADIEARMDLLEIPIHDMRSVFLDSATYNRMAADLANKDRDVVVEDALRRSRIGNFAGFETFRTNFQPVLPASAAPVTTVTGEQFHVPAANQTSAGQTFPLDNRGMTLTVNATATVAAGDVFTIPGVNEVSHINKNDTLQLRTFRVVSVDSGTTMTIYPRIVPLDQIGSGLTRSEGTYANVNTAAPAAATLTWVNTAAGKVSSFWRDGTVEVVAGQIAWDADMFPGSNFMRETTSSGIEIVMATEGSAMSGVVNVRLTDYYGLVNTDPQQNGIMGKFA